MRKFHDNFIITTSLKNMCTTLKKKALHYFHTSSQFCLNQQNSIRILGSFPTKSYFFPYKLPYSFTHLLDVLIICSLYQTTSFQSNYLFNLTVYSIKYVDLVMLSFAYTCKELKL